jgi:predicted nucleic acid-binding protein
MLALVLDEPPTEKATNLLDGWVTEGRELHAPLLAQYEIASVLTRKRAHEELSQKEMERALRIVDRLDVVFHIAPDKARAIAIALELQRHSAYDAAYLALVEELDAELWTLDGRLARNAGDRYPVGLVD